MRSDDARQRSDNDRPIRLLAVFGPVQGRVKRDEPQLGAVHAVVQEVVHFLDLSET